MQWKKSPPELIDAFDKAFPTDPRAERRKMFGYPCGFTGGNMFAGLHEHRMIVRLSESDRGELLVRGGTVFEPLPGRLMREYVALPASIVGDGTVLRRWLLKALEYAAALPRKAPKTRAAKATSSKTKKPAADKAAAKKPVAKTASKKAAAKKPVAKTASKKVAAKKSAPKSTSQSRTAPKTR